ncbi:MAG: membrane protein insertase YidC [Parachlamydiaceae bacterium]|nr:membrane protein insertase YidC [Parachlamydiaceae bacterium]
MDKRTLIFVIALTLALFGVNTYFENRNQDSLKEWKAQNQAKLESKQKEVEADIRDNTASLADLPIVNLYQDAAATQFLTTGVLTEKSVLTLAWETDIPHTVFSRKQGSTDKPTELKLTFLPQGQNQLVIYQPGTLTPISVGLLPEFGVFNLQIITPSTQPDQPTSVTLGHYVDGHLSLPGQQLEQMKQSVNPEMRSKPFLPTNGLVLMNTSDGFQAVAVYQGRSRELQYLDEIAGLKTNLVKPLKQQAAKQSSEEKFYVLETPYQQLVFSNFGGALAEINLPFKSDTNTQSVVKEIEFDREMVSEHPYNAHFPSHPYFSPGDTEPQPEGKLGGYYPLIRRDLIQSKNRKSIKISPKFYALNIVSEYPEVAELVYEVKHFDNNSIVFEANQPHRRITKTFTLDPQDKQAPYILNLTVKIEGDSRGLWLSSGVPEVEWISGGIAPALKYRVTRNQKSEVENIDLPQDSLVVTSSHPDWIGNSNGFLGFILDATSTTDAGYRVQRVSGSLVPSRLVDIQSDNQRFKADDLPGYLAQLPLKASGGTMQFRIFAGPFADSILKQVDSTYSNPETGYNPDYVAAQTFHGWFAFISEPFAKFLFILMKFFYQITGSWAFSIILLTVALRVMMYPLNAWSSKSMVRMQQIGPEVAAIQEKYKKDPKQAQIEVMNLYRERGVNPVSGCLPMLIQMPFLIGMFDLLKSTFELRGASFIPGWIDNLAAPDVLFSWNTPIFFIGNEFHLLPVILGLVMFAQQRLMSPSVSPSELTDQQRQQRAMGSIMSVVFALMFYNFPSGLNIYWLSSMLLGILQQWWTNRQMKVPVKEVKMPVQPKITK